MGNVNYFLRDKGEVRAIVTLDHTEYFAYFPSPLSIPHCGFLLRLDDLELQRYALSPPLLEYPLTIERRHDSTTFDGK
jgi:hypothetical protein